MDSKKRVVIVGSGIGGLICGTVLSKQGYHVTILERNQQIGGNLQTYVRNRHIFDSGVHYVGSLDKGQRLYKVFRFLGIMDDLKLQKLDEDAFDKILFHGDEKVYCYSQGYDRFKATLLKEFPDEGPGIDKYCNMIQTICNKFPMYNLREGDYMEKSEYLEIDAKTFIESITDNVRLRNVLAGNNALYAGIPDKTPIYVHALILNSYIESSYRFIDGGSQLAKQLRKQITNNGGVIYNRKEVTKLHIENKLINYAETETGERFEADHFISNAHPAQTLNLVDSDVIRPAYRKRIHSLENSISFFLLNINFKPGKFRFEKSNYYCHVQQDAWSAMEHTDETWPLGYAMFFSANRHTGEYANGITVMAYMHYHEVAKWKETFNTAGKPTARGADYEEFKKQKAEKLIDTVEHKFPGFRDAIDKYYTATPLTYRDYMGTDDGSIYGIMKDYKNPLKTFLSPRTKIDNLYLVGQNLNLHGILGVALSSMVTCSLFIPMTELLQMINDASNE